MHRGHAALAARVQAQQAKYMNHGAKAEVPATVTTMLHLEWRLPNSRCRQYRFRNRWEHKSSRPKIANSSCEGSCCLMHKRKNFEATHRRSCHSGPHRPLASPILNEPPTTQLRCCPRVPGECHTPTTRGHPPNTDHP